MAGGVQIERVQVSAKEPLAEQGIANSHHADPKGVWVTIPDLFVSFVSQTPNPNPCYDEVKAESEQWISNLCKYSEYDRKKRTRADFPYFAALWTTEAGKDEFRTVCDWCNWVFDFDDSMLILQDTPDCESGASELVCLQLRQVFDDGRLSEDPKRAQMEVDEVLALMGETGSKPFSIEEYPLRCVFGTVWKRVAARASKGKFFDSMEGFCSGLVGQVSIKAGVTPSNVEHYLDLRRESIGVYPCLALAEYFHALDLPDAFFKEKAVVEIRKCAADIVMLQNDILSFHKEQAMGVDHNLVAIFYKAGLSHQMAYDRVDDLLRQCYRRWYMAQSELPIYGEVLDIQVQKYLKACQDVVLANLNWSFKSERYFGSDNECVRRTRLVKDLGRCEAGPQNDKYFAELVARCEAKLRQTEYAINLTAAGRALSQAKACTIL